MANFAEKLIEHINKQQSSNNTDTKEAKRFLKYLNFELNSFRSESFVDENGFATIESAKDPDDTLLSVIARMVHWDQLSYEQRKVMGEDFLSWLISSSGTSQVQLAYVNNSEYNGTCSGTDIRLTTNKVITSQTPLSLITTLAHENQHYNQRLGNFLTKKNDSRRGLAQYYNSNEFLAYDNLLSQEDVDDLYSFNLNEREANLDMVEILEYLEDRIMSLPNFDKKEDLLKDVKSYTISIKDLIVETIFDEIDLRKDLNRLVNIDNICANWRDLFVNKIVSLSNFPKKLDKYLTNKDGRLGLVTYFNYASYKLNPDSHKKLTDTFLRLGRLEAVDCINMMGYKHTEEELSKATRILHEHTGDALLLPTMYRYLTHLDPEEIENACEVIIGQDKTASSSLALNAIFQKAFYFNPNLANFDSTFTIDPNNKRYYSFLINNLYPVDFEHYVENMSSIYLAHFGYNLNKSNSEYNIDEIIDEEVDNMNEALDNIALVNREYVYDIYSINEGPSHSETSSQLCDMAEKIASM